MKKFIVVEVTEVRDLELWDDLLNPEKNVKNEPLADATKRIYEFRNKKDVVKALSAAKDFAKLMNLSVRYIREHILVVGRRGRAYIKM